MQMHHKSSQFSTALAGKRGRRKRKPVTMDTIKYFTEPEIGLLRRTARKEHESDLGQDRVRGVRNWMVIDLLTLTGLRVSEAARLQCGNIKIGYGQSELYIENSKDGVSGSVVIPPGLKTHLRSFLNWKQSRGEGIANSDPLFIGERGPWTLQAIEQIVKRYLRYLGLYQPGKSVHSLRHSYAVALYKREKDLRAVQKQLRHVSIQSTLVYADVSKEEIYQQVKGLWN